METLPDPPPEVSDAELRGAPRSSLFLRASLRLAGEDRCHHVRVRNISASGLMGDGPLPLLPGAVVEIGLPNVGWIPATVAWSLESRFGLKFDGEIDPRAVRRQVVAPAGAPGQPDLIVRRSPVVGKPMPHELQAGPLRAI